MVDSRGFCLRQSETEIRTDWVVIVDKLTGASLILGCGGTLFLKAVCSVSNLTGKLSGFVWPGDKGCGSLLLGRSSFTFEEWGRSGIRCCSQVCHRPKSQL